MAVTTGKVRASYVHIFMPRTPDNGGEAKYSITLLIPKNDTATLNAIYTDIERAKQEGAQKAFGGQIPPQCKVPIYDGDGYGPSGDAFGEECRGCMVLRTSAKQQPVIVGLDMQNIINPADVYSGCYVRASVNMFAYNSNGNKGIGCGLNAVQKIEDGEPLSMRVSAEEAFGGANAYGGAAPYNAQQPVYQQPSYQAAAPVYQQTPYQAPAAPAYQPAVPQGTQPPAGQVVQQYAQQPVYQQGVYGAPAQQTDPITGRPIMSGGVMGI